MRWLILLVSSLLAWSGCSHAPMFVRKTPVLRWVYRPPVLPKRAVHDRFSIVIDPKWKGPEPIEGGMQFNEPEGRALISIAFHPEGSAAWKPPEAYRRTMREEGFMEDSHILQTIEISTHAATSARFTTYHYDKEYLVGEKVDVRYTEMILVPDPEGIYLIRYEATKLDFPKYLAVYEDFLRSVVLTSPKKAGKTG